MTDPVISKKRFEQFCRSKNYSDEYLKTSPLLMKSIVTGIRIALCEPLEPHQMVISNNLTGVLQGALDAIQFFTLEVDENAAISHVAHLLGHEEQVNNRIRFNVGIDYFGAALCRRSPALGELFAQHLLDVSGEKTDGKMLRLTLGIGVPTNSNFLRNTVIPAFVGRDDISRLIELVGDNYDFGSFCIQNSLTSLVRHIKSKNQKGQLLEIDLGV